MSESAGEIRLPKLGDTVTEGTIVRWLVAVGDEVAEGQPLAEIETDKVTTEYPSELAGTVAEILVEDGETVPVGTPILRFEGVAEGAGAPPVEAPAAVEEAPPAGAPDGPGPAEMPAATEESPPAAEAADAPPPPAVSPASEESPPAEVRPASPAAAESRPDDGEVVPLTTMRRAIAEHVSRSWSSTPHALSCAEVEVGELLELRDRERDSFRGAHGVDLSPFPLLVAAIADALAAGRAEPLDLGIATAIEDGLIVPVLRDAARDWRELALELADLIARARAGKLAPDEVSGGQSTVTNIGVFGGRWAQPILSEGQATIFALGEIADQPRPIDGGIGWRPILPISLAYDAGRLDPVEASRLLERVDEAIGTLVAETPVAR